MTEDILLLREYASDGSENAFKALVERYLPLVYSAAIRQVGGDAHLAQDVSQQVFSALARSAHTVGDREILTGWLYRTTRNIAAKTVRTECRRRLREEAVMREQALMDTSDHATDTDADWDAVSTHLDGAMADLSETDRSAILLRYFRQMDFRALGVELGVSDDTAQKRVSRALGKLRDLLFARGVILSAATLRPLLTGNAMAATPPGLAPLIVERSLAATLGVTGAGVTVAGWCASRLAQLGAAAAVAVAALAYVGFASRPSAVPQSYPVPPGLVSWWSGDESFRDRSGSNHAAVEGRVGFAPGVVGSAFRFDGSEGTRLRVPDSSSLRLTNEITLELWFRPDEDSLMGNLVQKRVDERPERGTGNLINYGLYVEPIRPDSRGYGIYQLLNDPEQRAGLHTRRASFLGSILPSSWVPRRFQFDASKNLMEVVTFNADKSRSNAILRGRWHHLACTYKQVDAGQVRMASYFDGECRTRAVLPASLAGTVTNCPVWIGGFDAAWFKGRINEIRLYERALGDAEVSAIHRFGQARLQASVR